jgi:hypothetical protein
MSRSIVSVKRYEPGMEDGFMVVSNYKRYKTLPNPNCSTKLMLVPYIFDSDGNKNIIREGDLISIINDDKRIYHIVPNKFKKYA